MTFTHRLNLLAFGLFGWCAAMLTAAAHIHPAVDAIAPIQAGLMAGCFATALLPGRTARFS